MTATPGDGALEVTRPARPLDRPTHERLCRALAACPDVAFAHLVDISVPGRQAEPEMTLLVWIEPEAVRSVRAALNLVCEAVAGALPGDSHLDVVILNSAPDLLLEAERAGSLMVERDSAERARALEALRAVDGAVVDEGTPPWWWPF